MKAELEKLTWKQIVALHKRLEGGGIGDYARRNKAGEIDLIIGKFQPEQITEQIAMLGSNVNVIALPARAEQPEQTAQTDVAAEVKRLMGTSLDRLEGELSALVQAAHKPAQIVEKRVEVPVEKIVEKIVEVPSKGAKASATVVPLFQPKVTEKTAKEVFGIELKAADGSPIKCEVYNDPLAPTVDKHYLWTEEHLHYALTALRRRRNVWLAGPRGTGKTQFVEQLCARLGRSCFRVNFNGATDKTEVLGGDTLRAGEVQYREGVILQGIRRAGAIVLLDEVGFARAEYLSALHAVLEANGCYTINETGETVAPAQGVVFFAADNSTGHGDASGAYAGLKRVNSAFLDRFAGTAIFEYMTPGKEAKILRSKTGVSKVAARHIADFMHVCRQKASVGDLAEAPSLRQAMYFAEALIDGLEVEQAFMVTISAKADPDSREVLRQVFTASVNQYDLREVVAGRAAQIGEITEQTAEK
jgi:MoxR-like ATPase